MIEQEEILTTGDPVPKKKPKFNPNAAYEPVREPAAKKPKFNPNVSFEPISKSTNVEQSQPKAFELKLSQPTFGPTAPTITGAKEFSFHKPYDPLAVAKLGGKAREAQKKLHTELEGNDKEYEKKLREYRRDSYTVEQLRADYKKNGWVLAPHDEQKILQLEKKKRYDAPITQTDISDIKVGTILNQSGARKFIKDLKRSDVLENAYLVDKYNELSNDPNGNHRVEKIKEVAKKINKGEVIYDPEKKVAIKPLGLMGSIIEGTLNKLKLEEKHDFFKNTENDSAIIRELEDQRNNPDTDEPIKVPKGKAQEILMMAAEMPWSPMIAGAIGTVGGSFLGNPEVGTIAAAAVGAYENKKIQFTTTLEQVYNELRDQGVDENEALAEARRLANHAEYVGGAVGAAQGLIGAKMSTTPFKGVNFSAGYQQAVGNLLKKNASELGNLLLEGAAQGGLAAAGEISKNKLAQIAGINREIDAGTADQFWTNVMMTAGIGIAIKGGRGLSKIDYKKILHGLKGIPEEQINANLQEKVNAGDITQEAADQTLQRINEYKGLDKLIPDNVTEEARFKIQDKIVKRNQLEQQIESTDKAYHPAIKEKIKAIDEEIIALSKETEKPPKSESGLTRAQEKEAIETAEEFLAEGILPNVYEEMIKKDPIGFWKMISQQAQNRDDQWRPLGEQISEQAVRDQFGDTVVEYAKELFPAPEVAIPESVSVIRPGEIKQPETITIKPKNNTEEVYDIIPKDTWMYKFGENEIPISEIKDESQFGDIVLKRAIEDIEAGKLSKTTDENIAVQYRDGKRYIVDGYHRLAQAIKENKKVLKVNINNESEIRHALLENKYQNSIKEGKITPSEAKDIIESADLEVPRDIQELIDSELIKPKEATISQEGVGQPQEEGATKAEEKVSGVYVERPPTQLSFRGLQDTANEFGFEDVRSRDRVSDIQERKNAEIETAKWVAEGTYQENINDLLTRIENRTLVPVARQRLILEQYLANEKQKARELPKNSEEYNRQLKKVERIKDIGTIARQEAGAALRLPDGGSLPHPILDEADAMIAKKRANAVDDLTDQQKAEVEAQVAKYKQAADEANAKVAKLEEQVSNIDASNEFNKIKSTRKRTKKTTEERAAYRKSEIEAAREALKKLRTGESGLSAVPLPGVRELMAIAPHVKNIMVDLVEQGVTELADAVKQLHEQFRDVLEGITEKDIHNIIAGEYNKPQKTKSQLQRQLEDLNYEAKLINKLESLERGIEPKAEKSKIERNQKIKALRDKIKEFRKQKASEDKESEDFYKDEIDEDAKKLISIRKRNEKRAAEIKDQIAKGEFEKEVKTPIFDREDIKKNYPTLRKEALDAIAKKEDAQHEFDLALFNDEMEKRPWYQKGASFAAKLIHTSKAVMSGIDDSATFVQNGLAMLANPKIGAKVWLKHWKEAFNEAEFKRELAAIHESPNWEIIKNSGLDIVEPHSAAAKAVEEAFEQNLLAGKIKIDGKEFQPWKYTGGIFERAFTSMGNNFRVALFEKRIQMLKDDNKTFESHPDEYKSAARAINELTGRGKLPQGLAQAAPYITPFVWAPRMLTSTVNALGLSDLVLGIWHKGYYQNLTPTQRKFALAQLGRGVGMGVALMGAAALGGATVDWDPRSVTFGDVIIGDHHYNVFGRFVPVVKTLVQFSFGERIKKGKIQDLDNPKYGGKTRLGVVGGFLRGKATPAFGAAMNLAEGRNYFTQEEFGVKDLPKALLMPMSIDDLIDGWNHDGTTAILTRFLPAFEGLKVSDERDFSKKGNEGSGGGAGATKTIKKGLNKSLNKQLKK